MKLVLQKYWGCILTLLLATLTPNHLCRVSGLLLRSVVELHACFSLSLCRGREWTGSGCGSFFDGIPYLQEHFFTVITSPTVNCDSITLNSWLLYTSYNCMYLTSNKYTATRTYVLAWCTAISHEHVQENCERAFMATRSGGSLCSRRAGGSHNRCAVVTRAHSCCAVRHGIPRMGLVGHKRILEGLSGSQGWKKRVYAILCFFVIWGHGRILHPRYMYVYVCSKTLVYTSTCTIADRLHAYRIYHDTEVFPCDSI